VLLVRDGAAIPQIGLAQSTAQMDWSKLELVVFAKDGTAAKGLVCLPTDNQLRQLSLARQGDSFKLASNPLAGKVNWTVRSSIR